MSVIRSFGMSHAHPSSPPKNTDAEQEVLGAILADNGKIGICARFLRADHFFEAVHGRMWQALLERLDAGERADPITIRHVFDSDEEASYPVKLAQMCQLTDQVLVETYARVVVETAVRLRAWEELETLRTGAADLSAGDLAVRLRTLGEQLGDDVQAGGRSELLDPSRWTREPPPRRWVVDGWIPAREVVLFSGQGGTGKSLLLQQLLTASAVGGSWLGLDVAQGPALGLFCEDDDEELERRQWAINPYLGITPVDLRERLFMWSRRGRVNLLATFDQARVCQPTPLFGELLAACKRHRIRLLVLDTLAHMFGGVEISRAEVTQFVTSILQRLADECDCSVLVAAHPSQSGLRDGTGLSGSTAWEGSVRSRVYLERPHAEKDRPQPDPDERVLSRKKANYGTIDGELRLRWKEGVLRPVTEAGGEKPNPIQAVVECMRELKARHEKVSPNKNANNYIVHVLEEMELARNFTTAELKFAIDKLKTMRRLVVVDYMKSNRVAAQEICLAGE